MSDFDISITQGTKAKKAGISRYTQIKITQPLCTESAQVATGLKVPELFKDYITICI